MEYERVKKSKLSFKGAQNTTDRKKRQREEYSVRESAIDEDLSILELPDEGWCRVEESGDLIGPLLITKMLGSAAANVNRASVTVDDIRGVYMSYLEQAQDGSGLAPIDAIQVGNFMCFSIRILIHMLQVVQAHPIPSSSNGDIYSLKAASGNFISCSKFGQVTSDSPALSVKEEWRIEQAKEQGNFTIQSVPHKTYLSASEGGARTQQGQKKMALGVCGTIRCDIDSIGPDEEFQIYCQAVTRKERKLKELDALRSKQVKEQNPLLHAQEMARMYDSRPERLGLQLDSSRLKNAQASGRLNEELLERRVKVKSDRYCK